MTHANQVDTLAAFGATPGSRRVALISCSSKKLDQPAPAASLYTSTLFRKSVAYAKATCDAWYVLSARHGLVQPEEVLEPYDERLETRPIRVDGRPIPTKWAGDVSSALLAEMGLVKLWSTTFVVLAGGVYEESLKTLGQLDLVFPLAGMQIGQRLQWLTRAVADGYGQAS